MLDALAAIVDIIFGGVSLCIGVLVPGWRRFRKHTRRKTHAHLDPSGEDASWEL